MKTPKRLIGTQSLNVAYINLLLYGEMDPDCPYIPREIRERRPDIALPKTQLPIGKAMIFGTGGDLDKGSNDFYKQICGVK